MKKFITAVFLFVGFSTVTEAISIESNIDLKNGKSIRLEYNPGAQMNETIQTLFLTEGGEESVVCKEQAKHQIDVDGKHGIKLYEKCTIVACDYKSNALLVLYAYEKGRQQFIRVDQKSFGYAPRLTNDKDILMVLYRKDQKGWKTTMSVFIQTMWGDTIGEIPSEVRIKGDHSCELRFGRKWKIVGKKDPVTDKRAKHYSDDGFDTRSLSFYEEADLVYSTDVDLKKFVTRGSNWWFGSNKDRIEAAAARTDAIRRAESAARANGIKLPDDKVALTEKLEKMSIEYREFEYFPVNP